MRFIRTIISIMLCIWINSSSDILFFKTDNSIIKWNPLDNKIDTIWVLPFNINHVYTSKDGKIITFTKSLKEGRKVGYYMPDNKKLKIINSKAPHNYDAHASPDNKKISFNYNMGKGNWEIAVLNILNGSITYKIMPSSFGDIHHAYGWINDSTIMVNTFKGFYLLDIKGILIKNIQIPDTSEFSTSIPGTELFIYNDTLKFLKGLDLGNIFEYEGCGGPLDNVFLIKKDKFQRLLTGKIGVDACFLSSNNLYIDYWDYSIKEGKHLLSIYNIISEEIKPIKSLGILIGIAN